MFCLAKSWPVTDRPSSKPSAFHRTAPAPLRQGIDINTVQEIKSFWPFSHSLSVLLFLTLGDNPRGCQKGLSQRKQILGK